MRLALAAAYSFSLTPGREVLWAVPDLRAPARPAADVQVFPVRKTGTAWGGRVSWQRNYPIRGPRGYRVTGCQGTRRLGPPLTFYLPAPV